MHPKDRAQMMAYMLRSGIKDKVKFASDVAKPVDKFEVQQIKLFNEFNKRNPRTEKADGGRIGFSNGSDRVAYKKINKLTDANRANFKYPPDHKYKVQIPTREDLGPGSLQTFSAKTKKELKKLVDKSPVTSMDYTKGLINPKDVAEKLPEGAVKFDLTRIKVPTGIFVGEGRDRSEIFKIQNLDGSGTRYTAAGAGGGQKKLYKSIEEVKKAKLDFAPDEFFVESETPSKGGIKEVTYKNRKTGEKKVFYKPRVGPEKATIPGRGAETKEEAQKFVDDYFKNNPIVHPAKRELDIKLRNLFDDSRIKKILRTGKPSKKDLDIVKDILGGTDRQAQEKLAQLADAVDPKGQRTIDGIPKIDGKKAKNIFNFHKTKDIAKELEDIAIGKSVGESPLGSFRASVQSSIPMKGGIQGYSVDEAKARASSVRLNSKPYSIFGQVIAGDINQGPKQTFDANLSIFEEQVKKAIKNNQNPIQAIRKYNKRAAEAEAEANQYKSRNTKKVYFPRITTDSPDIAIKNKSAYTKYKKFFDKNYAQQGYSFVIPKDLQPLPSLAADLKDKNSSTYKNMIKQIKDVGRKFIKNIDQFDEKELFQKLRNNPNFNTIRRLMPRLASLEDDFTGPGGFPLTAGFDPNIGIKSIEEDTFARRNPITTGAGLSAAGTAAVLKATGTPIRTALGKAFRGAGTRLGVLPFAAMQVKSNIDKGENIADAVVDPLVGLELSLPGVLKENLSKITTNPTAQRILNLGRFARFTTPVGAALGIAGLGVDAAKFSRDRIRELRAMSPEQRQELRRQGARQAFDPFSAAGGGIAKQAGDRSGAMLESMNPDKDGLPGLLKRVKKL